MLEAPGEGLPLDELVHEEGGPVLRPPGLEQAHDAGVIELRGAARLVQEARLVLLVRLPAQHLEGDLSVEARVPRAKDPTEGAVPELGEELEAIEALRSGAQRARGARAGILEGRRGTRGERLGRPRQM